MKAKVIETGEIVNVTPYPTWYKEDGQGPDRREWDEDELDFSINSKPKDVNLEKEIQQHINDCLNIKFPTTDIKMIAKDVEYTARKFFELGLKAQKRKEV